VSLKRDHSVVFEIDEDLDPQGIIDNFLNTNAPSNIGVSRRNKNTKKTDQNETDNDAGFLQKNRTPMMIFCGIITFAIIALIISIA
jgi:hypothetical protein